jgi:hypothetical protein
VKNKLTIAFGTAGAALGYAGTMLAASLTGFEKRDDPIMSGLLVLLVFAPIGALAGLVLATRLGMTLRGGEGAAGLMANSLKALASAVVSAFIVGAAYYVYAVTTATPWLNPNAANPLLQFEVRLPAGAATPNSARDIAVELQTNLNLMPGELGHVRRDGERPIISGEVELAYRTANRQLAVRIAGQPTRVYRIELTDKAPHTPSLGPWQTSSDGSEIRYRAKWPGQS